MQNYTVSNLNDALVPGKFARVQAWKLRRLVSIFNRVASRGHFPREKGLQRIYKEADIPLPADPRCLFLFRVEICYSKMLKI